MWLLLELLDRMYRYEMDPASIVEDTEQTPFPPQTDGQAETSIPSSNFIEVGGIKIVSDIQAVYIYAWKIRSCGQNILGYQQGIWATPFKYVISPHI